MFGKDVDDQLQVVLVDYDVKETMDDFKPDVFGRGGDEIEDIPDELAEELGEFGL